MSFPPTVPFTSIKLKGIYWFTYILPIVYIASTITFFLAHLEQWNGCPAFTSRNFIANYLFLLSIGSISDKFFVDFIKVQALNFPKIIFCLFSFSTNDINFVSSLHLHSSRYEPSNCFHEEILNLELTREYFLGNKFYEFYLLLP